MEIGKPVVQGLIKLAGAGASTALGHEAGEFGHLADHGLDAAHTATEAFAQKAARHKLYAAAMFAHAATRPGGEKSLPQRFLFDEESLRISMVDNSGGADALTGADSAVAFHSALVYNVLMMKHQATGRPYIVSQKTVKGIRTFSVPDGCRNFLNAMNSLGKSKNRRDALSVVSRIPHGDFESYFGDYGTQWELCILP